MNRRFLRKARANKSQQAFTVVELLIVIVVIGILAIVGYVAYSGSQDRARGAVLQSDLSHAAEQLNIDRARNGSFPETTAGADRGNGLAASVNTTYEYVVNNSTNPPAFCLSATNGKQVYHITDTGSPKEGECPEGVPGGGSTIACSGFNVGDEGPGGGTIFYVDGSTCYEAAPAGWFAATAPNDPSAEWGCYQMAIGGAAGQAVGTGKQNTADMLTAGCTLYYPQSGDWLAATIASEYNGGGLNDWYLPSGDELSQLHSSLGSRLNSTSYWSSQQRNANEAWTFVNMFGGMRSNGAKMNRNRVIPVRSFSD